MRSALARLLTAAIFTVTAPSGAVYTASTDELDHWTEIAATASGSHSGARIQAFQLLLSGAWGEAEAAEEPDRVRPAIPGVRRLRGYGMNVRR